MRNRYFERGGSRKTGTRRLRKIWKVFAWGLSISMILGAGNISSYMVDADDGEVQVTEIPAETSEPETETAEEPVFSVSPEPVNTETYIPETAPDAAAEGAAAESSPSAAPSPSIAPVSEAAAETAASVSPESSPSAAPYASMEPTASPEATASAEPSASPETASEPAGMPAVSFEDTEETAGIKVSVKAEEGTFPEGTTMELSPVTDEAVLNDAMQASSLEHAEAKAVDITFRDAAGNIIEPKRQIRVTMTADVIKDADTVDVVHVPDEAEKEENQSVQTEVVNQTADADLEEDEKPAEDQVVFDADQFSVYAIVYTVDFTFSGYTYSMEGGSSILLSSLASQLGLHDSEHDKDFDINEVADVTFSDPSLVSIERTENDFMLTSLQPFTSAETLTISMNDGSRYLVDVTDQQEA
ncbi:MAG: hypothetical protein ACI4WR_03015, partial [Bulleidia sp.]